ncbi:helix-turn-helix domain-containing protein [Gandjariella thermophila]|nr:GAF domain-containing protein [Gandjariella thermophila]
MPDGEDDAYLEMLLRDAPAADYERPVAEARARGAGPEAIAALERTKGLALAVRSVLARRRRREEELAALFQTASDLAGLRELDSVLLAIVRRARRLLGTDVAYLTLEDAERGDTYMRVTEGSVSAAFQRVRLPMGAGLGGLVAQTASPYATADYPSDARFRHTAEIDHAVADEGLVAILGVPLRLGAQVIGVLFAADRRVRPFAAEEVALLGSLADHAAVAIDGARMLQETRTALAELDDASRLLRSRTAAMERAVAAHDRLTDLVLRGAGLAQVAEAVTEVLGGALQVRDADDRVLATAGRLEPPEDDVLADAQATARRTGRAARAGAHWVTVVAAGSEQLGTLVLRPDGDLDDADQRVLERAAVVTALLLLFRRTLADAETRVRGDLLADLLAGGERDPAGLHERARRLGVDLRRPHVVVAVRPASGERQPAAVTLARFAVARSGLASRHEGNEVLLLPGDDPGAAARTVVRELGGVATAGAGGPVTSAEAVAGGYRDAARCLDAMLALGRHSDGAGLAELGFLGLVLGERADVDAFVRHTIGPLVDYDERRGTDLVGTLEAYFAAGRSRVRAHEMLHVHVNTVGQRLDRVGHLLGAGWQDLDRSLEIQLALRLHRVRGRRTAGNPVTRSDTGPATRTD